MRHHRDRNGDIKGQWQDSGDYNPEFALEDEAIQEQIDQIVRQEESPGEQN